MQVDIPFFWAELGITILTAGAGIIGSYMRALHKKLDKIQILEIEVEHKMANVVTKDAIMEDRLDRLEDSVKRIEDKIDRIVDRLMNK